MKRYNINDFKGGWFIGNFEPSILRTDQFEVGFKIYEKGEHHASHYHTKITEYNIVVSGSISIQGQVFNSGQIFVLEPGEIADPIFHDRTELIVVKMPSVPDDKVIVEDVREI